MPAEEQESVHEIDHAVARRLFKEYVQAKKAAGQSAKGLSYGKMLAKLSSEAGRLKERLGPEVQVRFQVKTIDGKVRLRALRDKGEAAGLLAKAAPAAPPKVAPPVVPPPVGAPKLAPPPIPGAKNKAPVVVPPPVAAPPVVPSPAKPLDETDEELGTTEIDHDDLDQMEEVGGDAYEADADDSVRTTLSALMREENEPLPLSAGPAPEDMTASQKLSFATLGDIAKRMDELAERKQAPERAAAAVKAEHDRVVLEGESSGEADIRSVAASIKRQMAAPEPEPGVPSGEIEGDSIPISLTDEDEVTALVGFGDQAAVAVVAHASIETAAPPLASPGPAAADEPTAKGGFPVGILLLLIIVVGGGVGYVMYGDQLLRGGVEVAAQKATPPPGDASAPAIVGGVDVDATDAGLDDSAALAVGESTGGGDTQAGETGETGEPGVAPAGDEPKRKKKKKSDSEDTAGAAGDDEGSAPDDAGEVVPANGGDEVPEANDPETNQVDCLLNPGAPGCKQAPKVEKKEEAPALPDKLSQNQLRDGFQSVKANAKVCGSHHGAESGTKVSVKVSIEGKTGGITTAAPEGEYAGTALGKCVADALKKATFPPFAHSSMGVTWSIRM